MMSPDKLCNQQSTKNIKLDIFKKGDYIVVSGDKETLEFLGNLILAQAKYEKDGGFQISPAGPGNIFFDNKSKYGIYIHRKNDIKNNNKKI